MLGTWLAGIGGWKASLQSLRGGPWHTIARGYQLPDIAVRRNRAQWAQQAGQGSGTRMATVQSSQTRLVYGLIRDGKLADAVGRLQAVLRVGLQGGALLGGRRRRRCLSRGNPAAPPSALQVAPDTRAALSLLAHCYYQQEEFEAAAQM